MGYSVAMTQSGEWPEQLATTVAAEVKRLRNAKSPKWSIRRLAEETEKIGYPIGASVLSNFEYGRRGARLDVAELLVLAAALDVAPALLLFPAYPYGGVQPLPDVTTPAFDAAEWVAGHGQMTGHPNVTYVDRPYRLVQLATERAHLNTVFAGLLEQKDEPGWMDRVFEMIQQTKNRRTEIDKEIRELGGVIQDGEG